MSTLNFKSQAKKQCSSFLLLDSKKLIYSGKTRIQRDFCRDYGQRKVSNKKNYMVYHTVVIRDKCLLKISKLKSLSLSFIFVPFCINPFSDPLSVNCPFFIQDFFTPLTPRYFILVWSMQLLSLLFVSPIVYLVSLLCSVLCWQYFVLAIRHTNHACC